MLQGKYRGHHIMVDTLKRGAGWTATYRIDQGEFRRYGARPLPSEEIVLEEAIAEAKWMNDRMAK